MRSLLDKAYCKVSLGLFSEDGIQTDSTTPQIAPTSQSCSFLPKVGNGGMDPSSSQYGALHKA